MSSTPLLCNKGTSVDLLPPSLDYYWYTSFFFLADPGPLHEIAISAFSRSPLGRANTFSLWSLLLTHRVSLSVPPRSPCFLVLTFPFFSILYFTSVLYPENFSMDSISSWFPPISFRTSSITLSHLIPARPFGNFLPYGPISYGWQSLF